MQPKLQYMEIRLKLQYMEIQPKLQHMEIRPKLQHMDMEAKTIMVTKVPSLPHSFSSFFLRISVYRSSFALLLYRAHAQSNRCSAGYSYPDAYQQQYGAVVGGERRTLCALNVFLFPTCKMHYSPFLASLRTCVWQFSSYLRRAQPKSTAIFYWRLLQGLWWYYCLFPEITCSH